MVAASVENSNGTQVYMIVAFNILISQDAESTTERDSHEETVLKLIQSHV